MSIMKRFLDYVRDTQETKTGGAQLCKFVGKDEDIKAYHHNKKTYKENKSAILKALKEGRSLTTSGWAKETGDTHLSQRVGEMISEDNLPIKKRWETSGTGKRFKVYYL